MNPVLDKALPMDLILHWGLILLITNAVCAIASSVVAAWKDRGIGGWFFLGLLLGPFAFLLALSYPKDGQSSGPARKVVLLLLWLGFGIFVYAGIEAFPAFVQTQGDLAATRLSASVAEDQMMWLAYLLEGYRLEGKPYPPAGSFPEWDFAAMNATPKEDLMRKDPFTGFEEDFRYRPQVVDGRPGWVLWSTGPDKVDDGARVRYDATNGLVSGGDIVLDSSDFIRKRAAQRSR